MSRIEKDIDSYIAEIKKNLICPKKRKKYIIQDLTNSVTNYVTDNNVTDINDVYKHFGSPKDIAGQFISEIEPTKVKKAFNIHKAVICGVVTVVSILVIYLAFVTVEWYKDVNGYYIEHIPEIVETQSNK